MLLTGFSLLSLHLFDLNQSSWTKRITIPNTTKYLPSKNLVIQSESDIERFIESNKKQEKKVEKVKFNPYVKTSSEYGFFCIDLNLKKNEILFFYLITNVQCIIY
jgi:hypothetical protein